MTTDTDTGTDTVRQGDMEDAGVTAVPRVRGRHRRPKPRKLLFAAGGLALAAGVLSLVRLAPESGVGGLGTAEAEPHPDVENGAGRSANTAATVASGPADLPSAAVPLGGVGAAPARGAGPTPAQAPSGADAASRPVLRNGAAATSTGPTTVPKATDPTPGQPASTHAPRPAATTHPGTEPAPAPSRSTHSQAPSDPGLCVSIIGLCVGAQGGAAGR
jgi:hypothetical protein